MFRTVARRLSTLADGPIPMSIADRVEAEAVRRGTLSQLPGRGKPLPEKEETQVAIGKLSQNMEARAEAEMRRYDRAGLLKNLGGEGKPDREQAEEMIADTDKCVGALKALYTSYASVSSWAARATTPLATR